MRTCKTCGRPFDVIPPPDDWSLWPDCLSPDCGSYDVRRDADILLCGDFEGYQRNLEWKGEV